MSQDIFEKDFRIDFHHYKDFVYDWGIDSSALSVEELSHKIFSLIESYLLTNLTFLPYGSQSPSIHDISFVSKYGWMVSSPLGISYLGKLLPSKDSSLYLGASTYLSGINHIWGSGDLHIGSYCAIGPGNT